MRLDWDVIRRRAKVFSEEWKSAHYEKGDTQTFYNEFFEIFGIRRKQVEPLVLIWPGPLTSADG